MENANATARPLHHLAQCHAARGEGICGTQFCVVFNGPEGLHGQIVERCGKADEAAARARVASWNAGGR